MKFSLILGTIGKNDELSNFLNHLNQQTFKSFELIVVDQSADDRLVALLSDYQEQFPILHLRSEIGLSIARNYGIPEAEGDVIAFPDDDCWYPSDLLDRLSNFFESNSGIDGLTGRIIDSQGNNCARFASQPGKLRKYNIWERANSNSIFLRATVIRAVGKFDENLGVGAKSKLYSSEDMDYVIRCVEKGFYLTYDPEITIFHPNTYIGDYEYLSHRAYSYGAGMGFTWQKHKYPFWFPAHYLLRALGGSFLSLVQGNQAKAKYHWLNFRGRWHGWRREAG